MELFFFTNRSARGLNIIASSCVPMVTELKTNNRYAPKKYRVQWRDAARSARADAILCTIRACAEYVNGSPRLDLELAGAELLSLGYKVEHVPARTLLNGATRPAYLRVS